MAPGPPGPLESPYCNFCHHNSIAEGAFACEDCEDKLEALMKATTALDTPSYQYEPSIQFKNVKLSSDYPGEAIVAIDGTGAAGVQKPFQFDGQGKCIVCNELTTNTLVCTECRDGISLARTLRTSAAGDWIDVMSDESLVALLRFVASNAVRKYMEAEIDDIGKS
jgi:hypothetical protein